SLQLPASAESLLLPNAAVVQHEGQTGVWRRSNGGLDFVPVALGVQGLDGMVQTLDSKEGSLNEGDMVVLYSQSALKADARITVVDQLVPAGGAK
ncbi:MAG: efflux transporter periplasmic adaptor subunit, partial [Hydrogenophaga sp.]|nr:efflux transporter periplasmic adaptor subunit [Hydrogenophaga sp.]